MSTQTKRNRLQRIPSGREANAEMPYMISNFSVQRVDRPKISAPVLLATTNVHTFTALRLEDARRIRKVSSISSNSSHASDTSSTRSRSTSVTTNSSVGTSPHSSLPPSPQSGSEREKFTPINNQLPVLGGPRRAASSTELRGRSPSFTNPLIPRRAPSHSKIAHENVARQRSHQGIQGMKSWQEPNRSIPDEITNHITSSTSTIPTRSNTITSGTNTIDFGNSRFDIANHYQHHHPFGKELEQLDEVAEEFGGAIRDAEREQDEIVMRQRNLNKFSAADYLSDLQPIFSRFFAPLLTPSRPVGMGGGGGMKCPEGWL